jgi:uncharacterized membrane-anchored protein
MMTRALLVLGALLVFGGVNWQIAGKERLRSSGQIVFLELAPIDPRSLMQGDYMALNFAVARSISATENGTAVLALDPRRVGTYDGLDGGSLPGPGKMRLRFRVRSGAVWLGTNAFFFHEGDAERYRDARYGEFRVNSDGDAMLVGLRDKDLRKM